MICCTEMQNYALNMRKLVFNTRNFESYTHGNLEMFEAMKSDI